MDFKIKVNFNKPIQDLDVIAYSYEYDYKQEYFHVFVKIFKDLNVIKHYSIPMTDINEISIEPIYEDNGEKIPSC